MEVPWRWNSDIVLVVVVAFIAGGKSWAVMGLQKGALRTGILSCGIQGLSLRISPLVPFWSCQIFICFKGEAAAKLTFVHLFPGLTSPFLTMAPWSATSQRSPMIERAISLDLFYLKLKSQVSTSRVLQVTFAFLICFLICKMAENKQK